MRRTVLSQLLTAWCPRCRCMTNPAPDGRCMFCDCQTGGIEPAPIEATPPVVVQHHLSSDEDGYGPECPYCGGGKTVQSHMCWSCRQKHGHRSATRTLRPRNLLLSEPLVEEARAMYATGLSIRQVAAVLWARTSYKSVESFSDCLYRLFVRRGYPLRPQAAVTAARNYRHGRGKRGRDEGAYRRFLKETEGRYQPKCAGCRSQYPRRGEPCRRPATIGSDYCTSHDPVREAARAAHMAEMRSAQHEVAP